MDPGKSARLALSGGAGNGHAIRCPTRTILGNLDKRLTMPVERSLSIFSLEVSVASGGLLVFVIQDGANQM
jgi:hypothetical protein